MRVTRAKQYRRHLRFFRIVYNITAPYKVILDGNFIHGCISTNVDIEQRLASVLQGASLHLYVPRAARDELKALGPAFEKAYKFAIGRCRALPHASTPPSDHGDEKSGTNNEASAATAVDPAQEILATIGSENAGKYLVSTQDEDLRVRLRKVPGCPLLFVSRTVLLMEQPSGKSKTEFEKAERKKSIGITEDEEKLLNTLKRKEREERIKERTLQPRQRVKKKASAPNPLSCKRPKEARRDAGGGKDASNASSTEGGKRRKRRKKAPSGEAAGSGGEEPGGK